SYTFPHLPMATSGKPSASAAVVLLALVVAAIVIVTPVKASTLTVFTGPGCGGMSKDINGCGCFDITGYQAGFEFVYAEEQPAKLYPTVNCHGPFWYLDNETRYCDHFDFQSVKMIC